MKVMIVIFIGLNLLIASISLIWAAIFLCMWPFWLKQNEKVVKDEY